MSKQFIDGKENKVYREKGDALSGDHIFVRCQKPGKWTLYQKSNQHKGSYCLLKKDAYAIIEKAYTNIEK
jgi:hypothetical protein